MHVRYILRFLSQDEIFRETCYAHSVGLLFIYNFISLHRMK